MIKAQSTLGSLWCVGLRMRSSSLNSLLDVQSAMPFSIIGSIDDVRCPDGMCICSSCPLHFRLVCAYRTSCQGSRIPLGCCRRYASVLPYSLLSFMYGRCRTVENEEHCDFRKLRSLLIRTHMLDLITTTEELQYETYRQQQMETRKHGEPKVKKMDNPKFKEEEEMLRKRFTEQVKAEEARFRQWEQHLIAERDRLNRDLGASGLVLRSYAAENDPNDAQRWLIALSSHSKASSTNFKEEHTVAGRQLQIILVLEYWVDSSLQHRWSKHSSLNSQYFDIP